MRSFVFSWVCLLVTGLAVGQKTSQQILKVSAPEMGARLLTSITPGSPKMPKCSNRMVTLEVVVGEDGKVQSLKAVAGFEEFRQSAMAAVKQWTYKPYLENEIPIPVETTVLVFYPSVGTPGSLFVPDGKGGVKNGDFQPMPSECRPSKEDIPTQQR
jgi:TonB family protein